MNKKWTVFITAFREILIIFLVGKTSETEVEKYCIK